MPSFATIRTRYTGAFSTTILCALMGSGASAQQQNVPAASSIPVTAPTTPAAIAQPNTAASTAGTRPPSNRAQITYVEGHLTVAASNSSLNQILREIARQTGMQITGGVADERVFGTYGPDTPERVLGKLLDGTGSNMLIVQNPAAPPNSPAATKTAPFALILTPRQGGPTPPNPNAPGFNDGAEPQDPAANYSPGPIRTVPPLPSSVPPDPTRPAVAAPIPAATDPGTTTSDQSPNGVKTPQQIYDQLLRLRQQQQTQQPQ